MIGTLRKHFGLIALAVVAALAGGCARSPQAKEARFLEDGKQRLRNKDYSRALLQFRAAVQVMPDDPEAHYQLGLALVDSGDVAIGAAQLRKATELSPKHYAAQLSLAQLMLTSTDPEILAEAQKRLEGVVEAQPGNAVAITALGFTDWKLGHPERAEQRFRAALEKDPKHLDASVALAKLALSRKDQGGAEAALRQAVANDPKTAAPLIALADYYAASNRLPEAEQQLLKATQADPASGQALNALAALQLRMGRIDDADASYRRLAQVPGKQYQASHAAFLQLTGHPDAALAELEKLYAADKSNREIRGLLVNACMRAGKYDRAERLLAEALKAGPNDTEALTDRANLRIIGGKLQQAQDDMTMVLRFHPDSAPAHHNMAVIYRLRGSLENERRELNEALRLNPRLLEARIDLAKNLIRQGAAQDALHVLDETPDEGQKDALAVVETRNWAFLALPDLAAARQGIDAGLKRARTRDLLLQAAQLKVTTKDMPGARVLLDEILAKTPEDEPVLQVLLSTYANPCEAGGKIRSYLTGRPNSPVLQFNLGQSLAACGKQEEARAAFQAAYTADPSMIAAAVELARLDAKDGKLDAARQRLTPLTAKSTEALLALSMVERQAGNVDIAINDLRKALDAQPRNPLILNNLAYLLADRGGVDEALALAQKAKEIAPHNANVDDTIGWAYFKKGIYHSALPYFELAVAQDASPRNEVHLAMACARLGDVRRGQQVLNAALKVAPDLPEAQSAKRLLAESGARHH